MNVRTTTPPLDIASFRPAPKSRVSSSARSQSKPRAAASENHLFVDNVRFWSMFGIIAMHCSGVFAVSGGITPALSHALVTPWKFGTIGFFLISGFLLGERLDQCDPLEYLQKRLTKVFLPWLAWLSLLVAFFLAANLFEHRITLSFSLDTLALIGSKFISCIASTAFWFVPNLLLSLAILLLFRRHLQDLRFGAALLAINLFYVTNIYKAWFTNSHTEALFGFVFYLWLGTYAARHFGRLTSAISRVRTPLLIALTAAAAALAYSEARLLDHLKTADPMNTLRLSNQIFSVAAVLLILKLRHATWPRFVDVRTDTFGLYLSHSMVVTITVHALAFAHRKAPGLWLGGSSARAVALWVSITAVVYATCLGITKAINAYPDLRWLTGSGPAKTSSPASPRLVPALKVQSLPQPTKAIL